MFGYWCVVVTDADATPETAAARLAALEAENAWLREKLAGSEQTLQRLRQAYTNALEQLQVEAVARVRLALSQT